jgi:predicted N-formylglutamate amidohydrolase
MAHQDDTLFAHPVQLVNSSGASSIVLICEHAAYAIPAVLDHLGLPVHLRQSHAAWDPGAMAVATRMSQRLDAILVAGTISRLVYDCNRGPDAPDAMPIRSEIIDVPGNADLSEVDKAQRIAQIYVPFHATLADVVARTVSAIIITIHSFTPAYMGKARSVEIGILHDADARLAEAMLAIAKDHTQAKVHRNEPYGPQDGVTHTLKEHAILGGHLNVMIEVRNDLITTKAAQIAMGDMIAGWVAAAFLCTSAQGVVQCSA